MHSLAVHTADVEYHFWSSWTQLESETGPLGVILPVHCPRTSIYTGMYFETVAYQNHPFYFMPFTRTLWVSKCSSNGSFANRNKQ